MFIRVKPASYKMRLINRAVFSTGRNPTYYIKTLLFVCVCLCQAEEAIVVESAKMQFSGRPASSSSADDVQLSQQRQQQQPSGTSDDARQVHDVAANQQSRRANR